MSGRPDIVTGPPAGDAVIMPAAHLFTLCRMSGVPSFLRGPALVYVPAGGGEGLWKAPAPQGDVGEGRAGGAPEPPGKGYSPMNAEHFPGLKPIKTGKD